MDGLWEVALVEVSYPAICYSFEVGLMTFHYDDKLQHVFSIEPMVFNFVDEFAKSLTDTLKERQKFRSSIVYQHQQKSRRLIFCNRESHLYLSAKVRQLTWVLKLTNLFCLIQKDHTIPSPGQRQIFLLILL